MEISKDERELYDRQIRLWGLEGQGRLSNARVLVLGIDATTTEAVKNLVLAGVGAIALQSVKTVTEESLGYNFFVTKENLGQNVAEASKTAIQRLNPRVALSVITDETSSIDSNFISTFNVTIASQLTDKNELIRLNNAVRSSESYNSSSDTNINTNSSLGSVPHAFYMSLLNGWGGLLFVDLNIHEYTLEKDSSMYNYDPNNLPAQISETKQIIQAQAPAENSGSTVTKLTFRETYVSLENALNVSKEFGQKLRPRFRSKVSPYLPAFLALLDSSDQAEIDINKKATQLGLSPVDDGFISEFSRGRGVEVSGIAAVIGGFLAQDVLNYLTRRELPIQNTLVYDALRSKGPVYRLSLIHI